jgi:hypothetical protein
MKVGRFSFSFSGKEQEHEQEHKRQTANGKVTSDWNWNLETLNRGIWNMRHGNGSQQTQMAGSRDRIRMMHRQ